MGLILGNCLDGLRGLPPDSVHLSLTSPTYGTIRPQISPLSWEDFRGVAEQLWRVTKEGGIVCWQEMDVGSGGVSLLSARHAIHFQDLGFRVHDILITGVLGHRFPMARRYKRPLTYVYVLSKGRPKTVRLIRDRPNTSAGLTPKHSERVADGSVRYRTTKNTIAPFGVRETVWLYPAELGCQERETEKHFPALMHEALARDLISSYSEENDLVLDPFAGACTTGKLAVLMCRQFLGYEVDPKYYEIGIRRLEAASVAARHARMAELAARWHTAIKGK